MLLHLVWPKPHCLDITCCEVEGENKIEIVVANRWINRLIGDVAVPLKDYKYDKTGKIIKVPDWLSDSSISRSDNRYTFITWRHNDQNSPLQKSGLIGPVKIEFF